MLYVVDQQERRNWIREGAEGAKILVQNADPTLLPSMIAKENHQA